MKKCSKQYKEVFRTKIDFKQIESHQERLRPGRSYYLEEGSNIRVSYDDIVNEAYSDNKLRP